MKHSQMRSGAATDGQSGLDRRASMYRLECGLPVSAEGGQLTMTVGPEAGAVIVPAALGVWILAGLNATPDLPPVMSHRATTWFFLTTDSSTGYDEEALTSRVREQLRLARLKVIHPGSIIILPAGDDTGRSSEDLREWISKPSRNIRPTVGEVVAAARRAITAFGTGISLS